MSHGAEVLMERSQSTTVNKKSNSRLPVRVGMSSKTIPGSSTSKKAGTPGTPGCMEEAQESSSKRKLFTIPLFSPLRRTLTLQLQSPKKEAKGRTAENSAFTRSPQRATFSTRSTISANSSSPRRNNSYIKRSNSPSSAMMNSPRRSFGRCKTPQTPQTPQSPFAARKKLNGEKSPKSPFMSRRKQNGENSPKSPFRSRKTQNGEKSPKSPFRSLRKCSSEKEEKSKSAELSNFTTPSSSSSCPTIDVTNDVKTTTKPTRPTFLPLKFINSIDVMSPSSSSTELMVSMDNITTYRVNSPTVEGNNVGLSHDELLKRAASKREKRKGGILLKSFSGDLSSFAANGGSNKSLASDVSSSSEGYFTGSSPSTHFHDGFAFISSSSSSNYHHDDNNNDSCLQTVGGTLVRNKSYSFPDKKDAKEIKMQNKSQHKLSRGFSASCRSRSRTAVISRSKNGSLTPGASVYSNGSTPDCSFDDVFSSSDTLSSTNSLHFNTPVDVQYKPVHNSDSISSGHYFLRSRGKSLKKTQVVGALPSHEIDVPPSPLTTECLDHMRFNRTSSESCVGRPRRSSSSSGGGASKIPVSTNRRNYLEQFYGGGNTGESPSPSAEPDVNNNLNRLKLGSHSQSLDCTHVQPHARLSSISADNTPMASPDEPPLQRSFSRRNRLFSFASPKRKKVSAISTAKKQQGDTYVVMETDSYGHFGKKVKTKQIRGSEPTWNEKFHLEIEACNILRLTTFNKLRLIGDEMSGKVNIDLARENIADGRKHSLSASLDTGIVKLNFSLRFSTTYEEIKQHINKCDHGVFAIPISVLCRREKTDIPKIVVTCIREVEKRGMDEVGIYRLSGIASEIQHLKKLINNDADAGLQLLHNVDVHAVAGLLKLYLRELPSSLFTSKLYAKFVNGLNLESSSKEKYMVDTLYELPRVNLLTALYLLNHLRKVVLLESTNKMGVNNLATVFGPTLLRPQRLPSNKEIKDGNTSVMNSLSSFDLGALDVVSQVAIFKYFLSLNNNARIKVPAAGDEGESPDSDHERWKRIDTERNVKVEMGGTQEFLI